MCADTAFATEENGVLKVRTCAWSPPGDHPVGCGLILHVEDGKLVRVEGDPDHPVTQGRLCPRCIALDEVVYHKDRLQHPMVRDRADRGKNKWKEITWDEAYDLIEAKVREIWDTYGAESIFTLTGTGRESTLYAPVYGPSVLNTCNGASTYAFSGQACYGPRATIANYLLGAGVPEIDWAQYYEDRYDHPGWECPKYLIIWGKDPLYSSPDGFFGHSIIDLMKRGSKIITIDPRLTWLSSRAEYHLQLRPGTDAAVGMGLLRVIIKEDLYDHDFVENWCFGFDELAEAVEEWTPEKVQEVTWVDADALVGAARAFATNAPSSGIWGVALDQSKASTQAGQCFLAIMAICGYLDVPGGIAITKPTSFIGKWRYEMSDTISPEMAAKHIVDPTGKYALFNVGAAMGGVQGDTL
ncbi:MAG: molybdopterin-dependent oxidoreductase, partial [Eggerthellaceae bacterium]|nr:molybdopterin-dependent oxidoreductase [Eggerthellaceae bacterium]